MHLLRYILGASLLSFATYGTACGGTAKAPAHAGGSSAGGSSNGATDDDGDDENEFKLGNSGTAASAHGAHPSQIEPSTTHAAVKFVVIDKAKEVPIPGIVISLQAPDGKKFYTEETDEVGYAEVLVPIGKKYELVYLTLGEKDINAKVEIPNEARQNIKLTLRYKPRPQKHVSAPPATNDGEEVAPVFRLEGVTFASNSTELDAESKERLNSVAEYLTYKKSARIEISGHTDNVGKAKKNKELSLTRAQSCRQYLIEQGIDGSRIEAVGHGSEKPVADNNTKEGQALNRRIEAREL